MHSVQSQRRMSLDRAEMSSRYQCQRSKRGYGPIRVRVILRQPIDVGRPPATPNDDDDVVLCAPCTVRNVDRVSLAQKKRRASATLMRLEEEKQRRDFVEKATEVIAKEKEELENELKLCKERLVSQPRSCAMQLEDSKKKMRSAQNMLSRSRKKRGDGTVDMVKLCKDIDKVVSWHFPGKRAPLKAKVVVDALCSGSLFQGEGVEFLNELKRRYVRDVFKDWKVLKAFDCSAIGAFKTSTVQALNSVLDEGKIGLFPSTSGISRVRKLLDEKAAEIVGCRREMTKYGEVYYINFDRAIRLLLKATGLYDKVQRTSVSISFTADGALLLNSRTHVSCGVKITDVDGIHPVTKLPLTAIDAETDEMFYNSVQSRELCAILVMADAKDSKEMYDDVFKEFYDYSERLWIHGMPACDGEPALHPFLVAHPQDMKSSQTVSKRGGNCKMKIFFCHLCSCTKHNLASYKTGDDRCNRCKRRNRGKCYHIEVCDTT